jgi:autotransporter-associated beta strand protein/YVTN family beta-propeller protein
VASEILNTMRINCALSRLGALVCCGGALGASAASGTWIKLGGGSWTNATNWSAGTIADGLGSSASFGTLYLTADATVTLDVARTIGNLTFDDLSTTKHNWFLNTGKAGPLTLVGATPTVTVNAGITSIGAVLAGSTGLTKSGTGKLVLWGANSYAGTTTVGAGTLGLGAVTFSATSPLNLSAASVSVESSGTLGLAVNTSATAIDVSGSGTLRLTATTNSSASPDLYFGPNHSANSCWGARLAASLDLGSAQRYVFGKTGHNGVGMYGLSGADCQFAGSVSGSGGLTFIAQNTWTSTEPMEVPFALNASNSFTGPVEIQRGSVYLGNANELYDWAVGAGGAASFSRTISLPGGSDPCGVAVSADGTKAYVCLSILNKLAVVDLSTGSLTRQINVGIAPWDVALSPDGNTAYVSDWGGRLPVSGDLTATSAGTPVVIDSRGVGASGAVSVVNLHPSALALSQDGSTLYGANGQLGYGDRH